RRGVEGGCAAALSDVPSYGEVRVMKSQVSTLTDSASALQPNHDLSYLLLSSRAPRDSDKTSETATTRAAGVFATGTSIQTNEATAAITSKTAIRVLMRRKYLFSQLTAQRSLTSKSPG